MAKAKNVIAFPIKRDRGDEDKAWLMHVVATGQIPEIVVVAILTAITKDDPAPLTQLPPAWRGSAMAAWREHRVFARCRKDRVGGVVVDFAKFASDRGAQ
jgi:hypothetical protein